MKILFSLIMSVTFLNYVKAANYYFSNNSGNDDRTERQAQSPSTPWKTLGKLNAYFSSLQPGDSVLLKRGETFYGSINVNSSGTAGSPIVIGAYGLGNRPVITSLVTLSGLTANENYKGVFESQAIASSAAKVNTVLINGAAQQIGRYPNSDAANKGYLNIESHLGTASITDNDLSAPLDWTGAELVLRSRRWVLDRDLITSQSGNTLFYNASSKYEPTDKYGYFIQNDIKTLDKFGEWYFDPSSKQLNVFLGKNNRSSYLIQVSTIDNLVSSSDNSYIVFDNLQIKGANVNGFLIKNGSNINIKNCNILFSGRDAVKIANHKNIDIENCTIANSNNNGIDLGFNGSSNATIRNNTIINTSVIAGMGGSGDGKGFAIQSSGKGTIIENNEILNTGYTALNFNGDYTVVRNNFIDSFCLIKDDGSAIYTYIGSKSNTVNKGRLVTGNIIMNGIGMVQGTNSNSVAANGIYMDVGAAGVEITGNTVANTSAGIFFHKAHDLIAKNNTLFGNVIGLYLQDNGNSNIITNNTITNNIFYSKNPKQLALSIETNGVETDNIGILDSNFYFGADEGDRPFKQISRDNMGKKITQYLNLNDWKNMHRYDPSSKKLPVLISNSGNRNDFIRFEYNPSQRNKTIPLNGHYTDAADNSYSNKIILKPYTSVILLKKTGRNMR
jgi:parallel beta-helix repeat protein